MAIVILLKEVCQECGAVRLGWGLQACLVLAVAIFEIFCKANRTSRKFWWGSAVLPCACCSDFWNFSQRRQNLQKVLKFFARLKEPCYMYKLKLIIYKKKKSSRSKLGGSCPHIFLCGCEYELMAEGFILSLHCLISCWTSSASPLCSIWHTTLPTQTSRKIHIEK